MIVSLIVRRMKKIYEFLLTTVKRYSATHPPDIDIVRAENSHRSLERRSLAITIAI